jgi:hypothetical protein
MPNARGKLYAAIKDINRAGHALHAGDLKAAAKSPSVITDRRRESREKS